MTPDEAAAARRAEESLDAETLSMIDKAFEKLCGRSFSEADYPIANLFKARQDHGEQNGDSSQYPKDSLEQIRRDFPNLFHP